MFIPHYSFTDIFSSLYSDTEAKQYYLAMEVLQRKSNSGCLFKRALHSKYLKW